MRVDVCSTETLKCLKGRWEGRGVPAAAAAALGPPLPLSGTSVPAVAPCWATLGLAGWRGAAKRQAPAPPGVRGQNDSWLGFPVSEFQSLLTHNPRVRVA